MGWLERLRRRLREKPPGRPPPAHRESARQGDEDEETAELVALEII